MRQIPRDGHFDSSLALLRDPYEFVSKTCRRYRADLFQTRLMLRPTICMSGPDAARLFYGSGCMVRHDAAPERLRSTLLGRGGVQGLDDNAHRHRKQMFMSLMTPERIHELGELTAHWLHVYSGRWASQDRVVLYDELHEVLTRAVCVWSGVPFLETEVGPRSRQLAAMFDYAGTFGPKHWWSRIARRRAEAWIEGIVESIRAGKLKTPERSAAHVIAQHRQLDGAFLPPRVAAVELLNVLRPTVAVSVFITLAAHALHQYPDRRRALEMDFERHAEPFVQEVRRFYPFFPFVMARTRHAFEWEGYSFPAHRRVLLDLYGTNHDPRAWEAPGAFRPERFQNGSGNAFTFVPQGAGDHHTNHRCPGEWITIELMKVALRFLLRSIIYDVPDQDLRIDYSRLPALPHSRFIIRNVRPCPELQP